MPLTDSEIYRIKREMGFDLLTASAEPYIGFTSYFDRLLQPYLQEGADTTSSTIVSASTSPTPVTLTLASAVGFSPFSRVVIDVDARQESPTIQSVSGSSITVLCSLEHTGTYPVTIEGGVTFIRSILSELAKVQTEISKLRTRVGIKKAGEEVEFFGGGGTLASQGIEPLTQVFRLRDYWRDELANVLGIDRPNSDDNSGGSSISIY